jgi:hypothetical protein
VSAISLTGFASPDCAPRDEAENLKKRDAKIAAENVKIAGQPLDTFIARFVIEHRRGTEHDGRRHRRC